ncbi:tryptophan 2,3-dioxygenase family protein [Saccharopolyspora phatthalungensis]|uniref:Tryptophan 2,3-dioxygenase n=1 Tax=Saccharopolyspora phatthalungensis TaxID=664693 RepID=A0A840QHW3_9PSEU|nr:tryptophan 2,3-dioxygenase family protein [Saccharopolyspora phatthalungensis]MBB5159821.1 tryptophan 2,3-dioxygenase [Saccharopolyspora phatthalungensis]
MSNNPLTYRDYLQLPVVLSCQQPLAAPQVDDEMLFIIVHQAYELWFKQLIGDLERIRNAMLTGHFWLAHHLFGRVYRIQELLLGQIDVLETMPRQQFLELRDTLGSASGRQSVQYWELELLSTHQDVPAVERLPGLSSEEHERLTRRMHEPSLWDAFIDVVERMGLRTQQSLPDSLREISQSPDRYPDVSALAGDLQEYDERAATWRFRHLQMTERFIATRSGTGGTDGSAYLSRCAARRYYPLLWDSPERATSSTVDLCGAGSSGER